MSFQTWQPTHLPSAEERTPVTILSGFLGAGKTTLLNKILAHSDTEGLAVIVNDVGDVNVDASLIRNELNLKGKALKGMLELQGGCICCSIQNDLADALLELWEHYQPKHILIEATGVAEPKSILESLSAHNMLGFRPFDFLQVANMVTVLDAANLTEQLEAAENTGGQRRIHMLPGDRRRPLQELLMEQIECADMLILNKIECIEEAASKRLKHHLKTLNPSAEICECSFGGINIARLMGQLRFEAEKTLGGAGWRHAILNNWEGRKQHDHSHHHAKEAHTCQHHQHDHSHDGHSCSHTHEDKHHHKDYGLESFVFNARRPFSETKFLKVLRTGLPGVLRAKGFYWTDGQPEKVGLLSIAGKMMRADYLSDWWHTYITRGDATLQDMPDLVKDSWLPDLGDRRQEIVFIGIDMDKDAIAQKLSECFIEIELVQRSTTRVL